MSGLAALLAGKREPGIFRWHGAFDVPDVRHTVEHAGWHFAHLDGWGSESKSEFLIGVSKTLGLAVDYARNFDALADGLHDGGYDDRECIAWLFLDAELPGRPIDALRENRGSEAKRRAQAMAL